jgi:organic hydroperoxide reductase OsmC/OhrA
MTQVFQEAEFQAGLHVSLPGIDRNVAQQIADEAHKEWPYSTVTHGNIHVTTMLV